jgi:para-nitrobenzyl esterase
MKSNRKCLLQPNLVILTILMLGLMSRGFSVCASEEFPRAPRVQADGETWEGKWQDDGHRYAVFRGIPYAAPPTGELRWQAPARRTPEPGVHMAKSNGSACIQTQRLVTWERNIYKAYGLDETLVPDLMNIGEDCLHLNIWTPKIGDSEKLPVFVWIYGGSNRSGWAHQVHYEGASLAKRGVVSVFINYRVGVFGWMSHPALSKESTDGVSGNYGILDQLAALEWVKRNISQFGGDPDKVTIAGESAGGLNVSVLLASTLAKGLYKRAIIQSSGFGNLRNLEANETLGTKIMAHLGVDGTGDAHQTLNDMRTLGAEEVLIASNSVRGSAGYGPVIDGQVLRGPILELYGQQQDDPVEVVIGVNAHEFSLFLPQRYTANEGGMPTEEDYTRALAFFAGSDEDKQKLREILKTEPDRFRSMERLSTAGHFLCRSNVAARQLVGSGHNVYYYYFTHVRDGQKQWMGAHHAAEMPYVFDTGNQVLPSNEWDSFLTEAMGDYWANFVRAGNPNGKGHVQWPLFKPDAGQYLKIGDEIVTGESLESAVCAAIPIAY